VKSEGLDSSVGIATRYGLDSPGIEWGGENFRTRPDPSWGSPNLQNNIYGSFPGVKRPRRDVDHPAPSSAEVKERVELYLYSPLGPSWPVLRWILQTTIEKWISENRTPNPLPASVGSTVVVATSFNIIWYYMEWFVIWYDTICYDMMWCGMIWYIMLCDMIYGMIYDVMWYDIIWYDIWCDVVWYDMIWCYDMIYDTL